MDTNTYPEFSTNYPLLLTTFMKRPVRYYPDQIGVVYRNHVTGEYQRFTWREWYQRVCQLAHALQDELKIQPGKPGQLGDRVGTMAYNTHRHLELYYAVPCTGATLHPINIRLSEEHIVYTINHAQDTVIFVDDVVMPLLENIYDRIKDTVKLFVYMSDKPGLPETKIPNLIEYEKLIEGRAKTFDWPYLHEDTIATLCYTTGTTGQPKGATFAHRQLYLMTLHGMARQSIVNTPAFVDADRLGENAVPMLNTPLFHIHGWGAPFTTVFSAQKVVLPGTFTVRGFCELVDREKVTSVGIVPTIAAMLLEFKDFDKYDLSSLTNVGVGGGALPLGLKTKLEKVLPRWLRLRHDRNRPGVHRCLREEAHGELAQGGHRRGDGQDRSALAGPGGRSGGRQGPPRAVGQQDRGRDRHSRALGHEGVLQGPRQDRRGLVRRLVPHR